MKQKRNVHLNFSNLRKKYFRITARKKTFIFCIIVMVFTSQLSFAGNVSHGNKEIKKYSHPKESIIEGCINASCLQISDELRICKCLKDKETFESSFILYQGQVKKTQWFTACNYGETSDFDVLKCDMEGNGKKEIIVANFDGQSNGMGVTYWTVSIIDPQIYGKPLTFGVEDYGYGAIYWEEKEKRCNILATSWEWLEDQKLGAGLYFIGRFFRYKSGSLEPLADSKIRARRYLFSFQNERGSTLNKNEDMTGAPLQWLTNAKTEILRLDPALDKFKGGSTVEGIIKEVILDRDGKNQKISVLLNKEKIINYIYPGINDNVTKDIIDRFAESSNGISYPVGYVPADPKQWLVGKRVDIFSRYDATREERHYFFLLKN